MKKIIYVPDVHFKNIVEDRSENECYNKGLLKVFDWLHDKYKNDILIINGDLFDVSNPVNDIRTLVTESLLRFNHVYLNSGNHDWKKSDVGNSLKSLGVHDSITVIDEFCVKEIEGINIAFFPHNPIFKKMKEYENIVDVDCHYSMLHCMPYEEVFGDKELKERVSVSLNIVPKVCHIYSHIHKYKEYVNFKGHKVLIGGIIQTTREGEQEWPNFVYELSDEHYEKVEIPEFMNIKTIDFENSIDDLNENNLYNIVNAPSKDSVYDKFNTFYFREKGIQVIKQELQEGEIEDFEFNLDNFEENIVKWGVDNNKDKECIEKIIEKASLI